MQNNNYKKLYIKYSQKVDIDKWGQGFFGSVFYDVYNFLVYVAKSEERYYDLCGEGLYSKDVWFKKYSVLNDLDDYNVEAKYYEEMFNMLYGEMCEMMKNRFN